MMKKALRVKDLDDLDGIIRGIHGMLCTRAVKDGQQEEEALLPLQQVQIISSEIVCIGVVSQKGSEFKLKRGHSTKEGSLDPSRKGDSAEGAPGQDAQGIGHVTHRLPS